ncbi:MAG: hypothetical protein ACOX5W_11640 [Bacillota bacterium]
MTAKAWCEAKDINYRRYLTWVTEVNREEQHGSQQWAEVMINKEKYSSRKRPSKKSLKKLWEDNAAYYFKKKYTGPMESNLYRAFLLSIKN